MSSLTTDVQLGEGFAFFCWHRLRWPEWNYCVQNERWLCVRLWRNHER